MTKRHVKPGNPAACLICSGPEYEIFSKTILGKYSVSYLRCSQCGFIHTERAYWLKEAYSEAISSLDVGLVHRNLSFLPVVQRFLDRVFKRGGRFLDYAGGYGLFTRLMRDKGFDFYRQDQYCENIFAADFDSNQLSPQERKFSLITAFEVFEHFTNPRTEMHKILHFGDLILFSTQLVPDDQASLSQWWYLSPESGQHISFYTERSLRELGATFGLEFYSNGRDMHLFTKDARIGSAFLASFHLTKLRRILNLAMRITVKTLRIFRNPQPARESLLEADHRAAIAKTLKHPKKKNRKE